MPPAADAAGLGLHVGTVRALPAAIRGTASAVMRPAVVPRVLAPLSGEPLAVDALVRDMVARGRKGRVAIVGPPGSGTSTALAWALAQVPEARALGEDGALDTAARGPHLYAAVRPVARDHAAVLRMAPWGLDEAIEYLLARHPGACASVVSRIDDPGFAAGLPALWVPILDRLAASERLVDVRDAVRLDLEPLRRFEPVLDLEAACALVASLRAGAVATWLLLPAPRVVAEAARLLEEDDLAGLPAHLHAERAAMAASLLHARGRAFPIPRGACFARACLAGLDAPGADLRLADLRRADLGGARLAGADLSYALATGARMGRVDLTRATLRRWHARRAWLSHATLRGAHAVRAYLAGAYLRGADAREIELDGGSLRGADLRGASFEDAVLAGTTLTHARIAEADLGGADLHRARLTGLPLREANLHGADLSRAHAPGVDLSGAVLPGARLAGAWLAGSLLTGARMPGADLRGAGLHAVRAGEVDWEGADLRGADLSHVDFHMGSSRSGLVDSVIASEGTRTGFYTDEYGEMHFKAPEEIRKANLRGADVRGACLDETDFYLVDLRDARYTREQAWVFERCGAILHDPPA